VAVETCDIQIRESSINNICQLIFVWSCTWSIEMKEVFLFLKLHHDYRIFTR